MKEYTVKEWRKALKNENSKILDVRSKDEFEEGHIPGATLVDVEDPQKFMDTINSFDKNKDYYIYCNSGNRGAQACMVMDYNGFKNTHNLKGGFENWRKENS